MSEAVVLVHGLWMHGVVMTWLAQRLRRCGFRVHIFSYASIRQPMDENVRRLQRFVDGLEASTVHFVGHSLGGRVILRLFHGFPEQRPGRLVLLCTPLAATRAAQRLAHSRLGRPLLGQGREELTTDVALIEGRDIGVIAGTLSIGLGRLISRLPIPNDGAVAVGETFTPALTDHLTMHVSHSNVLVSSQAARQICRFLVAGHFDHEDRRPAS